MVKKKEKKDETEKSQKNLNGNNQGFLKSILFKKTKMKIYKFFIA